VSKVAVRRDVAGAVLPHDDPDQLRGGIEDNLRSRQVDQPAAVNLQLPGHDRVDARFDDCTGLVGNRLPAGGRPLVTPLGTSADPWRRDCLPKQTHGVSRVPPWTPVRYHK